MAKEKTPGRKVPWQDLPVPDKEGSQPRRRQKKIAQEYQSALAVYRAMAAEFHQSLLKSKDFSKREK